MMPEYRKLLKDFARKVLLKNRGDTYNQDGVVFYDPNGNEVVNAGFQSYYRENRGEIRKGIVPERYVRISKIVPGKNILEIGSADGTQSLTLARDGKRVCGIELMSLQFEEALSLRESWRDMGVTVEDCEFMNVDIMKSLEILDCFDTVLISRVLYHLRADIEPLFRSIADSKVRNVVLIGCPLREARWREKGVTGDTLGKYAYYASREGMEDILKRCGFEIIHSEPSAVGMVPTVVSSRSVGM
ncbi:methyltransferase domain-containing protein [Roseovarius spongiae]|uniref:Methyltransferase domain-containing protein n=1 Tax=Roseovarius spongiae TaxID=2320272 RepID=A0A3A8B781_9RHOB|nr:methyltransferase domain-containing protein [Roseovarius spongiae]RKF12371.1 methyltransferase domain-containing protein [Roseovarius spongiae]